MKKLSIDKIKLSDMSASDQAGIQGGAEVETQTTVDFHPTTSTLTVLIISETLTIIQGCYSYTCLSKEPHKDSCTWCSTHQYC